MNYLPVSVSLQKDFNTGIFDWVPSTIGIPGQHTLCTGGELLTESNGRLNHFNTGASIDVPLVLQQNHYIKEVLVTAEMGKLSMQMQIIMLAIRFTPPS